MGDISEAYVGPEQLPKGYDITFELVRASLLFELQWVVGARETIDEGLADRVTDQFYKSLDIPSEAMPSYHEITDFMGGYLAVLRQGIEIGREEAARQEDIRRRHGPGSSEPYDRDVPI